MSLLALHQVESPSAAITVEMGGLRVCATPGAHLVTYALGSCLAVMLHDRGRRVAGMIHFMLPTAALAGERAQTHPTLYADTGVPLLFEAMYRHGCRKQDLVVKVAGGASTLDEAHSFDIGARNFTVLRKIFWKAGVLIAASDVGGTQSRTARLHVDTGRTLITSQGVEVEL